MSQRFPTATPVGRSAPGYLPNRFERTHLEADYDHIEPEADEPSPLPTRFFPDSTRSIIAENNSPDVPFRFSINPYRGCEHGCAYCYARPSHEALGFDAALDFESKIMVKYDAADLFRAELNKPTWQPELIALSGVTDCYQPIERKLGITRSLLEVALEANQPIGIVTKNALLLRDLDLLSELAERRLVHVFLSITTVDATLARKMEPRTSSPQARLQAISELSAAGVPTGAMVAPIIPGLTDEHIPAVLQAAKDAGAQRAGYVLLRLPHTVRPVFDVWLGSHYPLKRDRVLSLIRSTRSGGMNDPRFGSRKRGEGSYAEQIGNTFRVWAKKLGLDQPLPEPDISRFRPPRIKTGQMQLF